MPRLNPSNVVIASGLNGPVSIGRTEVAQGGVAVPRDAQRVVFAGARADRWVLQDVAMGESPRLLEERAAQFIAAGGGHYLASENWGAGLFGTIPVPSQYPCLTPAATDNRGAASDDGTFAITDETGQGFALLGADGSFTQRFFPGVPAYGVTVVRRGEAIMPLHGVLKTTGGLREPVHVGTSGRACWCDVPGKGAYVVHSVDGKGLVARRVDSTRGKILEDKGQSFHYDARPDGAGIRFVYATSTSELPSQIVSGWWDGESDLVDLAGASGPPSPPHTNEEIMVPAFYSKAWMACFYEDESDPIGNATIVVEKEAPHLPGGYDSAWFLTELERQAKRGRPLIVDGGGPTDIPLHLMNLIVAWWAGGRDADHLAERVARAAARPERPIFAYIDRGDVDAWPAQRPSWVSDRVWPSPQVYPKPGESAEQTADRVLPTFERVAAYGNAVGIVPRFDNYNGTQTIDAIIACMPLYRLCINTFGCIGILPFADRRGDPSRNLLGMAHVPVLREWARAFARAIPAGRPARQDGWDSDAGDPIAALEQQFKQDTPLVFLTKKKKAWLLDQLRAGGDPGEPDTSDTPPTGDARFRIDQSPIGDLFLKRWAELGIDAQTAAICDQFQIHNDEEFAKAERNDPARALAAVAAWKQVQCAAVVRIAGELHHVHGFRAVGLNAKDGGNFWELADGRKVASDILAILPTDAQGRVVPGDRQNCWLVDVTSSIGGPQTRAAWTPEGHPNLNAGRPWVEPPRP